MFSVVVIFSAPLLDSFVNFLISFNFVFISLFNYSNFSNVIFIFFTLIIVVTKSTTNTTATIEII